MPPLPADSDAILDGFFGRLSNTGGLDYSSYLAGSADDIGRAADLDGTDLVLTGETASADFPLHNALQSQLAGQTDVFLTRVSGGDDIRFSTFFGGGSGDHAYAIGSSSTSLVISGSTRSDDFPVKSAFQRKRRGGFDAFLAGFSNLTNQVSFSTFLGGQSDEVALGVDVRKKKVIAVGPTGSSDFPLARQAKDRRSRAFIARLAI